MTEFLETVDAMPHDEFLAVVYLITFAASRLLEGDAP